MSSSLDGLVGEATILRDHLPASDLLAVVGRLSESGVMPRSPSGLGGQLHRQNPGLSGDKVDDGISISRVDHNLKISLIVEELIVGNHVLLTKVVSRSSTLDPSSGNSVDGLLNISAVEVGGNVVINASGQNGDVEASRDGSIAQLINEGMGIASTTHSLLTVADVDEDVIGIDEPVNVVLVGVIEAQETMALVVLSQGSTEINDVVSRGVTNEEAAEVLLRVSVGIA